MPFMLLIAGGLLFWLCSTGRLSKMQRGDWFALAIAVLGTRFLTSGQLPAAGAMLTGVIGWAIYRAAAKPSDKPQPEAQENSAPGDPAPSVNPSSATMSISEARMLLGVDERATASIIRAAHRRRIARAHPDAGGNAELASRLNAARDMLLKQQNHSTDSPLS